jgi:amino acid permease
MNAGAMRGSIFALLASAMGSGMFNLPYRIDRIGIIPFLVYVFAAGLFSYIGMYLISRLIIRCKVSSYSEMCEKSYGNYFRKLADLCLIFYPWGITVCFQIIFSKFVMQILSDVFKFDFYAENGGRNTETYTPTGEIVRIGITVVAILVNLIFILKREIGILQKISIIGVVAVITNAAIIFLTFLLGFTTKVNGVNITYQGIIGIVWGNINWISLEGWPSFS